MIIDAHVKMLANSPPIHHLAHAEMIKHAASRIAWKETLCIKPDLECTKMFFWKCSSTFIWGWRQEFWELSLRDWDRMWPEEEASEVSVTGFWDSQPSLREQSRSLLRLLMPSSQISSLGGNSISSKILPCSQDLEALGSNREERWRWVLFFFLNILTKFSLYITLVWEGFKVMLPSGSQRKLSSVQM